MTYVNWLSPGIYGASPPTRHATQSSLPPTIVKLTRLLSRPSDSGHKAIKPGTVQKYGQQEGCRRIRGRIRDTLAVHLVPNLGIGREAAGQRRNPDQDLATA